MSFTINFKPQDPLATRNGGTAQLLELALPTSHIDFAKHLRHMMLLSSQINQISGLNNEAGEQDVNANGPTAPDHCRLCNNLSTDHMAKTQTPVIRGFLSDFYNASIMGGCEICKLILIAVSPRNDPLYGPGRIKAYIRPGAPLNILVACANKNARYDLFTPVGQPPSPWPGIGPAPVVGPGVSLDDAARLIQAWVTECTAHTLCEKRGVEKAGAWPKRVVSLSNGTMRLVEPAPGSAFPYVALSHCWGKNGLVPKTTRSNFVQNKARIDGNWLTPTLQHAVLVASKLGFDKIWIDSLCIIQDDAQDWKEQAAQMANIYENADLVISATYATHGFDGLFRDRKPAQILASDNQPTSWTVREPGPEMKIIPLHGPECKDKDCPIYISRDTARHAQWDSMEQITTGSDEFNPLLSRGWAFQERLMARRIVHFADHEMVFECRESQRCECMHLNRADGRPMMERSAENIKHRFSQAIARPHTAQPPMTPDQLHALWVAVVEKYTERMLTFEKDRLPALQGAMSKMQALKMGQCVGGTFVSDIPRSLLWQVGQPGVRHSVYRSPTWSWASVDPPAGFAPGITYLGRRYEDGRSKEYDAPSFWDYPSFQMMGDLVRIPNAEQDHYGIHFRAPAVSAALQVTEQSEMQFDHPGYPNKLVSSMRYRYTVLRNGTSRSIVHDVEGLGAAPNQTGPTSNVLLVLVTNKSENMQQVALVLRRLETTQDYAAIGMGAQQTAHPAYARIGILKGKDDSEENWFHRAAKQEIILF